MGVEKAINFDDLRLMAKRRLPKIAFDFIEGGIDSEEGLGWNVNAFSRQRIVPKYLVDASVPKVSTTLFGRTYSQPYGIAPTGAIGMFRVGGDAMLARAAKQANVPFIISGMHYIFDSVRQFNRTPPRRLLLGPRCVRCRAARAPASAAPPAPRHRCCCRRRRRLWRPRARPRPPLSCRTWGAIAAGATGRRCEGAQVRR